MKILFVAECVTLAHFGRMVALASSLPQDQHQIGFASSGVYNRLLPSNNWAHFTVHSITPHMFTDTLAKGDLPYTAKVLEDYVQSDFQVIDSFKPDLIVGDFRLSLGVSARVRGVPYINIINAYWEPAAYRPAEVPEPPASLSWIPVAISDVLSPLVIPLYFSKFAKPFHALRQRYGLPAVAGQLRGVYCDADYTLYDDVPELVPLHDVRKPRRFMGAINWSIPAEKPDWFDKLQHDRAAILVSTGSSGDPAVIPKILKGLLDRKEPVVVITAGHDLSMDLPQNFFVTPFMPIKDIMPKCGLMISNGGNASYHALAAGVPVVGLPRNYDQFLCSRCMQDAGVATFVRGYKFRPEDIAHAVDRVLVNADYVTNARHMQQAMARYDYRQVFAEVVAEFSSKLPVVVPAAYASQS